MNSDNFTFAKSAHPQSLGEYTTFTEKQYNYISDINNGVYTNNSGLTLVTWDLTSIYNAAGMADVSDLFLAIPIVMVAQTTANAAGVQTVTTAPTAGYGLCSLKTNYQNLIHQIEVVSNGKTVSQAQPFVNVYEHFKLLSTLSATDMKGIGPSLNINEGNTVNKGDLLVKINDADFQAQLRKLELQAKLLRVIETNEFIKLGDTKTLRSNFRLIAATNKDLKKESEEQHFRSDLYFRLNVFQINLLPLRERIKDIEPLAKFFVKQFSEKTNKKIPTISKDFLENLETYHWPGNIRELKNVIERSIILSESETLMPSTLPFELQFQPSNSAGTLSAFSMESIEKLHIQKVLNYTKGNKAEAARLMEIGVATLYRKMEEYKIH
jgi:hypothetical protein